jgi:hypothetical protein
LQEELDTLNVPVKLAFMLKEQLHQQAEQKQAASAQDVPADDVLAQLPPVGDAESLHADIMQRRMPAAQRGSSSSSSSSRLQTSVRSAPLQSLEPYSLQVTTAGAESL